MRKRNAYERFLTHTRTKPLLRADVEYLAANIRQADYEEILAASGPLSQPLGDVLWEAAEGSEWAVVAYVPATRRPMLIYGVESFPAYPGVGFIWMHGTEDIGGKGKQAFLRLGRCGLQEMREKYHLLVCFPDSRNSLHIHWLRWMGFTPLNVHFFRDPAIPFLEFVLQGQPHHLQGGTLQRV